MKKGDIIGPKAELYDVKSPSGTIYQRTPFQSTFVCDFKPVVNKELNVKEVNMELRSETKEILCLTCERVVTTKTFYMVAIDAEGKEHFVHYHTPTGDAIFKCAACLTEMMKSKVDEDCVRTTT